jgi:hypothetical protein
MEDNGMELRAAQVSRAFTFKLASCASMVGGGGTGMA